MGLIRTKKDKVDGVKRVGKVQVGRRTTWGSSFVLVHRLEGKIVKSEGIISSLAPPSRFFASHECRKILSDYPRILRH